MSYWIVDRTLPGVVAALAVSLPVWVSHLLLRRHVTRVTERQNRHIDQLTAEQTAALTASRSQGSGAG